MKLVVLTDDAIRKYAKGREVTELGDFNLKYGQKGSQTIIPIKNGLYDSDFFSSVYERSCNCGNVRVVGKFCHRCNCELLSVSDKLQRYAYIDLPVYFITKYKIKKFVDSLNGIVTGIATRKLGLKDKYQYLSLCHYTYDMESNKIHTSLDYDGTEKYYSLEGLVELLKLHFPSIYESSKNYLNRLLIVTPAILRPITFFTSGTEKKVRVHKNTSIYQSIIYLKNFTLERVKSDEVPLLDKIMYMNYLRQYVQISLANMSQLNNTSKQNIARNILGKRVANTARATIVPDIDLPIDKILIPEPLAYEMYKTEFLNYLKSKYMMSESEAASLYYEGSLDTLAKFYQFIDEGRSVIFNRAPTLHKYSIIGVNVGLTKDISIHMPPLLCKGMNADFDGDALSVQAIPDEYREYVMSRISPSATFYMEKNLSPLFTPSHEFLYGIYLASRVNRDNPPVEYKNSNDLEKMYEDGTIDADTLLKSKPQVPNTYGRIRISNIIGDNIDNVLSPDEPVTAKNIVLLMAKINLHEDRLDRIKRLQDLAVEQMRLIGITSLSLKDLYVSLKPEFKKSIDKIADDPNLTPTQKLVKIQEVYDSYIKSEFKNSVSDKVKRIAASSDRVKVDQLINITMPNMVIQADGSVKVSESSIFSGMTPDDYVSHAVSNRHVLQIKANVTPISGYVTRQLTYISQMFRYKDEDQPTKDYIEIPRKNMIGRVTITGKYLGSSYRNDDTLDKFPSCIFNEEQLIYRNQIRTPNHDEGVVEGFEQYDGDNIGISFGTSITETVSQAGLALKHGGSLRRVVDDYKLIAQFDGKVTDLGEHTLTLSDGSIYYHTSHLNIINYEFKKGDTIAYVNVVMTPAYRANSLTMLLDGFSKESNRNEKNILHRSVSRAPKSGTLHYKYEDEKIQIFIDSDHIVDIPMSHYTLILHPDGHRINQFDPITTDVLSMFDYPGSVKDRYTAFRLEFIRCYGTGMTEELMEFLFRLLFDSPSVQYLGVKGAMKRIPILSQISFGYATNHLRKIDDTDLELEGTDSYDLFTNLILGISSKNS